MTLKCLGLDGLDTALCFVFAAADRPEPRNSCICISTWQERSNQPRTLLHDDDSEARSVSTKRSLFP